MELVELDTNRAPIEGMGYLVAVDIEEPPQNIPDRSGRDQLLR